MTTAVDTNVLVALWDRDPELNHAAQGALDEAASVGALVISAPVYCELLAAPGRTIEFLESFLKETGIAVDWELDQQVWRLAAEAFRCYASRRRKAGDPGPRRVLADFVIGAHASLRAGRLLTLDDRVFRTSFPKLAVVGF